jgi:hypothetical protein
MLGIEDPWIIMAYMLCVLSAVACIVYGLLNWNKGAEKEPEQITEEAVWEEKEQNINEIL